MYRGNELMIIGQTWDFSNTVLANADAINAAVLEWNKTPDGIEFAALTEEIKRLKPLTEEESQKVESLRGSAACEKASMSNREKTLKKNLKLKKISPSEAQADIKPYVDRYNKAALVYNAAAGKLNQNPNHRRIVELSNRHRQISAKLDALIREVTHNVVESTATPIHSAD
jgi:hypothetical protein